MSGAIWSGFVEKGLDAWILHGQRAANGATATYGGSLGAQWAANGALAGR